MNESEKKGSSPVRDAQAHERFSEAAEIAAQRLIADVQYVIEAVLNRANLTRRALAHLVGRKEATISRELDSDANLTLRTIARLATALNDEFRVSSRRFDEMVAKGSVQPMYERGSHHMTFTAFVEDGLSVTAAGPGAHTNVSSSAGSVFVYSGGEVAITGCPSWRHADILIANSVFSGVKNFADAGRSQGSCMHISRAQSAAWNQWQLALPSLGSGAAKWGIVEQ